MTSKVYLKSKIRSKVLSLKYRLWNDCSQDHEVFSVVGALLLMQSLLNHCPLLMGNDWVGGTSWAMPIEEIPIVTSLFGMAGPSLGWWQVSGSMLLLLPAWPHHIAVVFGDSCYSHPVAAVEKGNTWHWHNPCSSHANIPFCLDWGVSIVTGPSPFALI